MLNPFPDLLVYSLLAPFILRVVAGSIFINLGVLLFRGEKERWLASLSALNIPNPKLIIKILGIIEVVSGIMLILGFYTQIASLILALLVFAESYIEYKQPEILKRNFVFYIILLAIVLSLLLSGAGRPAFDLPL
ncbi:MAG: DoxX family protein [Patescibacteria group bacterium]